VHNESTFREEKTIDSRDIHFAIRVNSYRDTREFLRSKGFHPETDDDLKKLKESPQGTVGWPQLYIMDPDRNVIELDAEQLDEAV
jgi:glyoxylase I family protein